MAAREQIEAALEGLLQPEEAIQTWRPVMNAPKTESWVYEPTPGDRRTITSSGEAPDRTDIVVVTDRRIFWCNRASPSSPVKASGATPLSSLRHIEIKHSPLAPWRLCMTFEEGSVVTFQLPSNHRADGFAADVRLLLQYTPRPTDDLALAGV